MSSPTKSPKKPHSNSKTTPTKPKPTSPNSKPSSSKKNPITKINMTTSPITKKMPKQVAKQLPKEMPKQVQPHPTALRATTAASSNVSLDRKLVRNLAQRSDLPGLLWLASWIVAIALSGYLLYLAQTLNLQPPPQPCCPSPQPCCWERSSPSPPTPSATSARTAQPSAPDGSTRPACGSDRSSTSKNPTTADTRTPDITPTHGMSIKIAKCPSILP